MHDDTEVRPSLRRSIGKRVWLHGFLPVVLTTLLWLFSMGSWILWIGSPAGNRQAAIGKGTVSCFWKSPGTWRGIGQAKWNLGTGFSVNGQPVTWYAMKPLWARDRVVVQRELVIKPGVAQIPLFYVVAVSAVFPVLSWRARRRHRAAWQCKACGYDLRGSAGSPCPECGREEARSTLVTVTPPVPTSASMRPS